MKYKKILVGALGAFMIAMPLSSALAFGPDRTTYACNSAGQCIGADHVQFNSFTNNSVYGDERNFLTVRDVAASTSTYSDSIQFVAGKTYVIRFYVHNNAQQSLAGASNYIAHNTSVRATLPSQVNGNAQVTGYISASNANPGSVFDDVALTSTGPVNLQYVTGSARILTNGINTTLSDSIVSASGAPVGYNAINGEWPGCFEFSGWVTLQVQAIAPVTPAGTPPATPTVTPVAKPVVTTSGAKAIPNTGPGDIAGLFVGTSALGTAGHYLVTRRRR